MAKQSGRRRRALAGKRAQTTGACRPTRAGRPGHHRPLGGCRPRQGRTAQPPVARPSRPCYRPRGGIAPIRRPADTPCRAGGSLPGEGHGRSAPTVQPGRDARATTGPWTIGAYPRQKMPGPMSRRYPHALFSQRRMNTVFPLSAGHAARPWTLPAHKPDLAAVQVALPYSPRETSPSIRSPRTRPSNSKCRDEPS